MASVVRKNKKRSIRTFKGLVPANSDQGFEGLGSQHASVKLVEVENPHYSKAHAGASGNPKTITAAMNLRESPIAMMAAKGHLDVHQVQAGLKFRLLWEALGGSGAAAFDYSREPVDGGGSRDPISERQIDAGIKLKQCETFLGRRPYDIVSKVAGQGCFISELGTTQRERKTLADYLRDALDDLAEYWELKTKARRNH